MNNKEKAHEAHTHTHLHTLHTCTQTCMHTHTCIDYKDIKLKIITIIYKQKTSKIKKGEERKKGKKKSRQTKQSNTKQKVYKNTAQFILC